MRDLKTYHNLMKQNLNEKTDFIIKELQNNFYDTVVDFGCADGSLIKELAVLFPNIAFIGVDNQKEVINMNRKQNNLNNILYHERLDEVYIKDFDRSMIIFSSVLHEIFSFCENKDLNEILEQAVNFNAVAIRDMYFEESDKNTNISFENSIRFKDFKEKTKHFKNNKQTMTEYLLKVNYTQNWESELLENYFATDWVYLKWLFEESYFKKIYFHKYLNNYLYERTPFLADFTKTTHIKMIWKRL